MNETLKSENMIALSILFLIVWIVIGALIYMANFDRVTNPLKKIVLSCICGPVGIIWGLVNWCTND